MAGRLKDKVAIVVGAGSSGPGWGNGKCTAVTFAREGAKVMCVDRKRAAAEETVGLIAKEGGEAMACRGRCVEERRREGDGRCLHGQVGPHRRARQQCRHRLDRRPGRAQRGRMAPGVRRQREELLPHRQARAAGHGEAGQGRDRQRELDRLDPLAQGRQLHRLQRQQGRGELAHPGDRLAVRRQGHPLQRHPARPDAHADDRLPRRAVRQGREGPQPGLRQDDRHPQPRLADRQDGHRLGHRQLPPCSWPPTRRPTSTATCWWSTAASRQRSRWRVTPDGQRAARSLRAQR